MARKYEGDLSAKDLKIGLVVSRFNGLLSKQLLAGAMDALVRHGANENNIDTAWVPGAFETPFIAGKLAKKGSYDAVICLGVVIRGETPHFDYICREAARGIATVSRHSGVPITFGIVTADNTEQALERCGLKSGNKGWQAASAAIEMANLVKNIDS